MSKKGKQYGLDLKAKVAVRQSGEAAEARAGACHAPGTDQLMGARSAGENRQPGRTGLAARASCRQALAAWQSCGATTCEASSLADRSRKSAFTRLSVLKRVIRTLGPSPDPVRVSENGRQKRSAPMLAGDFHI